MFVDWMGACVRRLSRKSNLITRPLGASFADWAGDPVTHAGLGLGKGHVAAVLTVVIVAFVAYLAAARRDVPHEAA